MSSHGRPRRVEALFKRAIELQGEDRQRFVLEACAGDADLLDDLSSLIAYHADTKLLEDVEPFTGSLEPFRLDEIAGAPDTTMRSAGDDLKTATATYTITDTLGEGGMGVVYRARQIAPVRRDVALKIVKLGRDVHTVRFEFERQALAFMHHRCIAQLYDSGVIDGRAFFVMELVEGTPITKHCDDRTLTIEERLRLFRDVCAAIDHAHQKGIIHRDLKPSNILVAETGGVSVPKIIDFGVAKSLRTTRLADAFYTQHGVLLGSPEYMSPEQAEGRVTDIDTRADVYALGVVLHELLTGRLPIEVASSGTSEIVDLERRAPVEEPRRPSETYRTATARTRSAAARRRSDAPALARRLEGDLDWIVGKALETERVRRYQSVSDLASDIAGYLDGNVVSAGPPTVRYRLGKLVRKHRVAVASTGAAVLALLLALPTSAWLYAASRRALAAAEAHRDEVLRVADVVRLDRCLSVAEELYPPHPRLVPAMEAWLPDATELASRLPLHEASLRELERRLASNAFLDDGAGDPDARFRHRMLSTLVARLRAFGEPDPHRGAIADVRDRLAFARRITHDSLVRHECAWQEAITAIADSTRTPAYRGLVIEPQLGLVPLGPDPDSGLWEFGHLQTGPPPERRPSGKLRIGPENGCVLVLIPGGTFRMGAAAEAQPGLRGDLKHRDDELPVHEVSLDPFFLAKYELTQAQWRRIIGEIPSWMGPGTALHVSLLQPVERVTQHRAARFARMTGLTLPTEAQWEYAARAGTETIWPWGSNADSLRYFANVADERARLELSMHGYTAPPGMPWDDGFAGTAPIGSKEANPFGLHDTVGNVLEWCRDLYGSYEEPVREGDGLRLTEGNEYVARGGSYRMMSPRVARRVNFLPVFQIGFRLARPLDTGASAVAG